MSKINSIDVSEMESFRANGESLQRIADRFEVSNKTVSYHLNPQQRKNYLTAAKKWRKRNPATNYKSVCLSQTKWALRKGFITIEDIRKVIKELKEEK